MSSSRIKCYRTMHAFVVCTVPLPRACSTDVRYGVATISTLLKIIGLFGKI